MKTLTASLIVLMAASSAALAQTGSSAVVDATDYTTVDCNAITTRKTMMREYNEAYLKGAGTRVIDVLDQKKLSATPTSISCYGAYSFSDGSTRKITYKEMINSLKQTVWTFTPDT